MRVLFLVPVGREMSKKNSVNSSGLTPLWGEDARVACKARKKHAQVL